MKGLIMDSPLTITSLLRHAQMQHGAQEIVSVTGDHVAGPGNVDVRDVGKPRTELDRLLLGHEVAHPATYEHHRHVDGGDRGVEPIDVGDLTRGEVRGAADEGRIPVPEPAAVTLAQVLA